MTDYKLMPRRITEQMADAFWEEYSKNRNDDLLMRCYKAMYAVAPQPAPDVARLAGKMARLIAAGNRLNAEAEECTYADGMAEVAGSEYWCEFRDALEAATEALATHRKGGE